MMKRVITIVFTVFISSLQMIAQDISTYELGNIYKTDRKSNGISCLKADTSGFSEDKETLPRKARVMRPTRSEVTFRDVTLNKAGTLASILGEETKGIDSLIVRGPVNASDFHTMWSCSFYGGTTVINLKNAAIKDNKLPTHAFWYQSEQYTPGSEYIDCIPLRRIILPEGLQEIGTMAFTYAICLEEVNLPSSLRAIKRDCFSDCISFNADPLIIPEGVEEIGYGAFVNCMSLTCQVVLPSTIKRIGGSAFFQSKISECNFPEGLEEIGDAAFYASCLKEAILPNTCQSFPGASHFMLNYELEKVYFPDGPTVIPDGFVNNCISMTEFRMPDTIEDIEDSAFWQCGALKELHISNNLKSIGTEGLYYCKGLRTITFPSTLEILGAESCKNWKNIESIYCEAPIPPRCIPSDLNPGNAPFGDYDYDFINRTREDIPVYVPIGSADLYRNAWGWNYFSNYIETDFSGVKECFSDEGKGEEAIYDLYGRKVINPLPNQLYIKNGKKVYIH